MPFFNDVASHVSAFSSVAAFAKTGQIDLSGNGTASVLSGQAVSGGFFSLLGIRAAAGRLITPSDDSASAQPVVVLNYGYWKRQFGGSPSVIEKTVRLNNVPFTIIGVADPRFDSLSPGRVYDVWVPLSVLPQLNSQPWVRTRATDVYSWIMHRSLHVAMPHRSHHRGKVSGSRQNSRSVVMSRAVKNQFFRKAGDIASFPKEIADRS
jgi:hypothetical protein